MQNTNWMLTSGDVPILELEELEEGLNPLIPYAPIPIQGSLQWLYPDLRQETFTLRHTSRE